MKDYKQEAKTHKEKLMQNHRVRKRIDEIQEIARKLVSKTSETKNSVRCALSTAAWAAAHQQSLCHCLYMHLDLRHWLYKHLVHHNTLRAFSLLRDPYHQHGQRPSMQLQQQPTAHRWHVTVQHASLCGRAELDLHPLPSAVDACV